MNTHVLERYEAFLIDIDGVLVRGREPIRGSVEALDALRDRGRVLLLSNNSTRTRRNLAEHLRHHGFRIAPEETVPSSFTVARHLLETVGPVCAWPVGEQGLRDEMIEAGHRIAERPEMADWVVAGMDRHLTYATLADALTALENGARLVATNDDATFPTPDGPMPGAGAIIGAFRGMGHEPELLVGKPSLIPYRLALATLDVPPNRVLMIGDRLETDILGGRNAGIDTAFVLSGISTRADIDAREVRPTWIAQDLTALARGDVEAPAASPSST